jgi:hypothetical protein
VLLYYRAWYSVDRPAVSGFQEKDMSHEILKDARSLEESFFLNRDAELMAEMRHRETVQTRKKALAEVSGITNEDVLDQLVKHEIHAETLAAFSLVPIIAVAWADGAIQLAEEAVILHAVEEAGIQKESVAFQLTQEWLRRRPEPKLMQCWKAYTQALMSELTPEACEGIRRTVLGHARAVAEAAGGFLGLGRVSHAEEKMLRVLEEAFEIQ